jgi:hypothetical protein
MCGRCRAWTLSRASQLAPVERPVAIRRQFRELQSAQRCNVIARSGSARSPRRPCGNRLCLKRGVSSGYVGSQSG